MLKADGTVNLFRLFVEFPYYILVLPATHSCNFNLEFLKLLFTFKSWVMIIVHDIFICKPGNASKFAKLFKEVMADNKELVNIMTDLTGSYNKVVMVTRYENLTAYEENFQKYMHDSEEMRKMKEKMKGYQDLYLTGSREIYQVL